MAQKGGRIDGSGSLAVDGNDAEQRAGDAERGLVFDRGVLIDGDAGENFDGKSCKAHVCGVSGSDEPWRNEFP